MHNAYQRLRLILLIGVGVLITVICIGTIVNKRVEEPYEAEPKNRYSCVAVEDEFEITFYSNTNNIIFSERYPKEPRISQITENIFEISISVGSPATYVLYVDTEHAEVSETFFNPLLFADRCVAYMEDGKLILRDIFRDDLLYMTISREFTRTADPMSAIIAIERTDEGNITLSYYKGEDYEETSESIVITDESRQPDIFINDSMEQETETETYLTDFNIHPLYAAFLRNEVRVANPYTANELTFFDDREYGFECPWKNFSLVDVNNDGDPELVFKMTQSPSEVLYIFGVQDDELICYDVFETHTTHMSFTVYDNGTVWWGQNYDGAESVGYTFTDDGKKQELIHFVWEETSDSNLYYDYYYLEGNEGDRFSLGSDAEYESLAASYGYMGEEPEWYDCESFSDIPQN